MPVAAAGGGGCESALAEGLADCLFLLDQVASCFQRVIAHHAATNMTVSCCARDDSTKVSTANAGAAMGLSNRGHVYVRDSSLDKGVMLQAFRPVEVQSAG